MKKISLFLIFLVILVGGNCWAQAQQNKTAEEKEKWHKVHEFSVGPFQLNKAVLTKGLKKQVVNNLGKIPDNATLLIDGYTDSSGSLAQNKPLAKLRAQEVGKEINSAQPSLSFNCTGKPYNSTDSVNYRMVRVRVYAQKASSNLSQSIEGGKNASAGEHKVVESEDETTGKIENLKGIWKGGLSDIDKKLKEVKDRGFLLIFLAVFILAVVVIITIISLLLFRKFKRGGKNWEEKLKNVDESMTSMGNQMGSYFSAQEEKLDQIGSELTGQSQKLVDIEDKIVKKESDHGGRIEELEKELKVDWIEVDLRESEKIYRVKVERREGVWYSPFISKQGRPIYRKDPKDLEKHLKDGLKHNKFSDQIDELVYQGKVVIKDKTKNKGGEQ